MIATEKMRDKAFHVKRKAQKFRDTFGVSLGNFFPNIILGFDIVKFDDWLREHVEAYDEDKESMADFITRRYSAEASELIRSFI